MLLAYKTFTDDRGDYAELCIISANGVESTRVRLLNPTDNAVYYIGSGEGVSVERGDEPRSIIVHPVDPAPLYLTPDSAARPGFKVANVKIKKVENDYEIFYTPVNGGEKRKWKASSQVNAISRG